MEETLKWIEEHPAISAVIGVGGTLILLYLLGFFGSSSNAQTGQSNLAAAYYAAEAAQTTAGTQLNMVQANDLAATQQAQIQANAATSIATTQAGMYTTLGNQNLLGNQTLYNDEMITANTSANDAVQTAYNANNFAYLTAQAGNAANENITAMQTIIPAEIAQYGNLGFVSNLPGGGTYTQSIMPNPGAYIASGYTPEQAAQLLGVA